MRTAFILAAFLAGVTPAAAQSPYQLPATIGTTATQVAPVNQARKWIRFVNPSATATIAVCPLSNRITGAPTLPAACTVNGSGSITIVPLGDFLIDRGAAQNVGSGWLGVASSPATPITVLEAE